MNEENNELLADSLWLRGCRRHEYVIVFVRVFDMFFRPVPR